MRVVTASFPEGLTDSVAAALESQPKPNWSIVPHQDGRCEANLVIESAKTQFIVDALQRLFSQGDDWRIVVIPVEAALLPKANEEISDNRTTALREEIYQDVLVGTKLNVDFIALTIVSSTVAALGINADNVAVVIGAMVIAPLLGPILAFSFGSAIGDLRLMWQSAKTAVVGLATGLATAFVLGSFLDINLDSIELQSRTVLGLDSVALALASGAAAALSIVTGLSATLVGVMVAVALLPPSVALALFLGAGEFELAIRAAFLLLTNVVCVVVASQLVFLVKGIHPRTWRERKSAKRSIRINLAVWGTLLLALILIISAKFA